MTKIIVTPSYSIYEKDNLFFLDTYEEESIGFETLEGAFESAYYQGLRDTKEMF